MSVEDWIKLMPVMMFIATMLTCVTFIIQLKRIGVVEKSVRHLYETYGVIVCGTYMALVGSECTCGNHKHMSPIDIHGMIDSMPEKIAGETDSDCQWFLFCMEPAIGEREHPILGKVPVCQSHTAENFPTRPDTGENRT